MTPPNRPRFDALVRAAQEIWAARPDLRDAYEHVESLGFWNWLMSAGAREYPEILAQLPLPDERLRDRVAEPSVDAFLDSGLADAQNLFRCLSDAGLPPGGALLDFGCGCARILRYAARLVGSWELFGVDVDPESIDWCRTHLDFATFDTIRPFPPTTFPARRFDVVYAYSVFTHLPEELHLAWLDELHRLLRPGGVLVVTTSGRTLVEKLLQRELPRLLVPTADELACDVVALERKGFLYYPLNTPAPWLPAESRDHDTYGMTFVLEPYIRRRWLERFELVAFHEAPSGYQDHVVLRRGA